MPYPAASRLGDPVATLFAPIVAIEPAAPPAGPGQQEIIVHSSGLHLQDNVTFYPVNPLSVTNPTTQGWGGTIYDVSPDGTTARVLVDFGGNVTQWMAQVISPYTNQQSPPFPVTTVPGAPIALDPTSVALEMGGLAPEVAIASTQLSQQPDGQGGVVNVVIVTGATAALPQPDGSTQTVQEAVPGVFFNDDGGGWTFTPYNQLTVAQLNALFGDLVTNDPDYEVDPFGLPLPSSSRAQDIAWYDRNGNPIVSPWFNAYLNHATLTDSTSAPRTTTEAEMQSSAPANSVPVTGASAPPPTPLVVQDADGNPIPGAVINAPATTPAIVSVLPSAPSAQLAAASVPATIAGIPLSTAALIAAVVGGLWYLSKGRR